MLHSLPAIFFPFKIKKQVAASYLQRKKGDNIKKRKRKKVDKEASLCSLRFAQSGSRQQNPGPKAQSQFQLQSESRKPKTN